MAGMTSLVAGLIPEYCMKINEKFELYLITTGCDNLGSKE
jgi:hypothetical protein